jgi:hypothetical protein
VSRNLFQLTLKSRSTYCTVAGNDCEIDHNEFRTKNTEGEMLLVVGPGTSEMAQRTWIHHNYFHDFKSPPANNCSAIQIGMSGRSMSSGWSLTESNLFVKCAGENEGCICNKSSDNTYRYNTFGGTFGGPIYVPGHWNQSRTKMFAFYNLEQALISTPGSLNSYTMPTALERQGDFSQTLDTNGKVIPITDSLGGPQFPDNVIPKSRLNPNGQALMNILPQPNFFNRTTVIRKGSTARAIPRLLHHVLLRQRAQWRAGRHKPAAGQSLSPRRSHRRLEYGELAWPDANYESRQPGRCGFVIQNRSGRRTHDRPGI